MGTLQVEAQHFFGNTANRGHADRTVWSQPLEQITGGLRSGREIAEQALGLVAGSGLSALDVGCSYGPIVFGLAASERVAEVVGLDVEDAALALGRAIAGSDLVGSAEGAKCQFVSGQSEQMPFPPGTFDLIVCNTVIEHVYDVEATLRDMMRVLKPGGALYLCAPNYLWPYEPHLKIWMPPLGPKGVAKLVARCAPGRDPRFIDHLNFVNAPGMERLFRKQGLVYRNLYLDKLARILVHQQYESILGHRRLIPLLRALHALRITRLVYALVRRLGLYPSMTYSVIRPEGSGMAPEAKS